MSVFDSRIKNAKFSLASLCFCFRSSNIAPHPQKLTFELLIRSGLICSPSRMTRTNVWKISGTNELNSLSLDQQSQVSTHNSSSSNFTSQLFILVFFILNQ